MSVELFDSSDFAEESGVAFACMMCDKAIVRDSPPEPGTGCRHRRTRRRIFFAIPEEHDLGC